MCRLLQTLNPKFLLLGAGMPLGEVIIPHFSNSGQGARGDVGLHVEVETFDILLLMSQVSGPLTTTLGA